VPSHMLRGGVSILCCRFRRFVGGLDEDWATHVSPMIFVPLVQHVTFSASPWE
jgi:hypothetical protein